MLVKSVSRTRLDVFDLVFFFFQAEVGIRDLVRSRGLGDVYKRQTRTGQVIKLNKATGETVWVHNRLTQAFFECKHSYCLLYTSDAADERSSVDLGGRRIIKKKNTTDMRCSCASSHNRRYE